MELQYCEKCQRWYQEPDYKVGDYLIFKVSSVDKNKKDIGIDTVGMCPDCMKEFAEWWGGVKK